MYLNLSSLIRSCSREYAKYISARVDQTHPTKSISSCVDQTYPLPARIKNASNRVLTKSILKQQEHKMHLNIC
jgi:hypothetical protein